MSKHGNGNFKAKENGMVGGGIIDDTPVTEVKEEVKMEEKIISKEATNKSFAERINNMKSFTQATSGATVSSYGKLGMMILVYSTSEVTNFLQTQFSQIKGGWSLKTAMLPVKEAVDFLTGKGYTPENILTFLTNISGSTVEMVKGMYNTNQQMQVPILELKKDEFTKKLSGGLNPLGGIKALDVIDVKGLVKDNPLLNTGVIINPVHREDGTITMYINLMLGFIRMVQEQFPMIKLGTTINDYKIGLEYDPSVGYQITLMSNKYNEEIRK